MNNEQMSSYKYVFVLLYTIVTVQINFWLTLWGNLEYDAWLILSLLVVNSSIHLYITKSSSIQKIILTRPGRKMDPGTKLKHYCRYSGTRSILIQNLVCRQVHF